MNLPNILLINIQSNGYFKDLLRLRAFQDVVDEIEEKVEYIEPWIPRTRTPSTAFCLLYKLFTVRMTAAQLKDMLRSNQQQMVRGMGFLFVRFCIDPKQMWKWIAPYVADESLIKYKQKGAAIPLYEFIQLLFLGNKYCDILFPRIPIPIAKELKQKFEEINAQYEDYDEPIETTESEETSANRVTDGSHPLKNGNSIREPASDRSRRRSSRSRSVDRAKKHSSSPLRRQHPSSRSRGSDDRRFRNIDRRSRYQISSTSRKRSRSRSLYDSHSRHEHRGSKRHHRRSRSRSPRKSGSPSKRRASRSRGRSPRTSGSPGHNRRSNSRSKSRSPSPEISEETLARFKAELDPKPQPSALSSSLEKLKSLYAVQKPSSASSYYAGRSRLNDDSCKPESFVLGLRY